MFLFPICPFSLLSLLLPRSFFSPPLFILRFPSRSLFSLRFFPLFPHFPLPSFSFPAFFPLTLVPIVLRSLSALSLPAPSSPLPVLCLSPLSAPFFRCFSFFIFGFWFLHRVGFSLCYFCHVTKGRRPAATKAKILALNSFSKSS